MALILYTVTVIDHVNNPNNTLANTDIVIRTTQSGAPLAIIYADEDGLIPIAQPGAKTNDLGVFEFYAASANYNFTATVNGETRKIGGVNASSVMTESSGSVQDFIDDAALTFDSVQSMIDSNVKTGVVCGVYDYYGADNPNNSGVLIFRCVDDNTWVHDGGRIIQGNGVQFVQNMRMPYDPRACGAIGDGNAENASINSHAINLAISYGSTNIRDGNYVYDSTILVAESIELRGAPLTKLDFIGVTGPCIHVYKDSASTIQNAYIGGFVINDNGEDRASSWSVVMNRAANSTLDITLQVGDNFNEIYGDLTQEQKLDLKFGLHVTGLSFTNWINSRLYGCCINMEAADNHIVDSTVWANGRRYMIKTNGAVTIEGNQLIPGAEFGVYSDLPDITLVTIVDNYFDGNTKLQSEIPTGHMIYFAGNLRRSTIASNRFFIPAKRAIHIGGTLMSSSISGGNVFSNGDAADLGFGDIYANKSTGSVITGNTHYRDNLAAKTGLGRTQPAQPPITVNLSDGEFDEPTIISSNSLQGTNFYSNSVYPSSSAIVTKNNHRRFNNFGKVITRYSDGADLLCYKTSLNNYQLDNLPHGVIYTDSLFALGITDESNASGYITTTIVQDANNLSSLTFGKQEVITNAGRLLYIRSLVSGVWSSFRQI